jgi:succinate-semialdehyde dehydrogenase/glutarate-semialdehyde dehydrogenase
LLTLLLPPRALCFTGSRATGRDVARAAAATAARSASGIPPRLLLELGGKDGVYVRADADVARAVRGACTSPRL